MKKNFNIDEFTRDIESGNFTAKEIAIKFDLLKNNCCRKIYYLVKKYKIKLNLKKDYDSYRTLEYKEKISKSLKGKKRSSEQIENYKKSAQKRGNNRKIGEYRHSEQTKFKIRESNLKTFSNEKPIKWMDSCLNNPNWFKKLRKTDIEKLNDWESYVYKVRSLTKRNARKYSNLIEGKKQNDYHLDHIVSISDGFNNNIDIEIICHYVNLRYISAKENLIKNYRSEMTIEELKEKYFNSETK